MLNVLLETRAARQRRTGGAALSVAVHVAIIAAATATAVAGTPAPRLDKPAQIAIVVPDRPRTVVTDVHDAPRPPGPFNATNVVINRVAPPTFVPPTLPPIDPRAGAGDSIVIGGGPPGRVIPTGIIDGAAAGSGDNEWRGSELLMHLVTTGKPRYPDALRQAGVEGQVLIRFTVDTTGRIDLTSVQVISSTHELFTRAVRDALANFRFRPAEANGKHVAALAEMPFQFALQR